MITGLVLLLLSTAVSGTEGECVLIANACRCREHVKYYIRRACTVLQMKEIQVSV